MRICLPQRLSTTLFTTHSLRYGHTHAHATHSSQQHKRRIVTETQTQQATTVEQVLSSSSTASSSSPASPPPPPPSHSVSRSALIDRLLRVDHAGEYGAQWIYEGQLTATKHRYSLLPPTHTPDPFTSTITEMRDAELAHLDTLNRLLPAYRVRPSALLPLTAVSCYTLGYISGLLGEKTAMACTQAVEQVITEHYNNQLRELTASVTTHETSSGCSNTAEKYEDIKQMIKVHRDEEEEHRQIGAQAEAELHLPFYGVITRIIQAGCYTAIKLAERI